MVNQGSTVPDEVTWETRWAAIRSTTFGASLTNEFSKSFRTSVS
jgi:hypothetical protein